LSSHTNQISLLNFLIGIRLHNRSIASIPPLAFGHHLLIRDRERTTTQIFLTYKTMFVSTAAARALLARSARKSTTSSSIFATTTAVRSFASLDAYAEYGKSVFTGRIADEYLKKHGSSADILDDPSWTNTHADTVAKAVLDW
jgi:hypothetical protein